LISQPPLPNEIVIRDGVPLPGMTVPDVVSQLIWRVLGPLKGRAKSVLDWAGLGPAPPAILREIGARYGVSGPAVGQRIQRVTAVGSRLPLTTALENEVSRRSAPGENHVLRCRWAVLLGRPRPEPHDGDLDPGGIS
jgi:hypothetical protein